MLDVSLNIVNGMNVQSHTRLQQGATEWICANKRDIIFIIIILKNVVHRWNKQRHTARQTCKYLSILRFFVQQFHSFFLFCLVFACISVSNCHTLLGESRVFKHTCIGYVLVYRIDTHSEHEHTKPNTDPWCIEGDNIDDRLTSLLLSLCNYSILVWYRTKVHW